MVERSTVQLRGLSDLDDAHGLAALLLGKYFDEPVTNTVMAELWHLAMRSAPLRERLAGVYRPRSTTWQGAWRSPAAADGLRG